MRISCKGPLRAASYVYCYLKNQFYVFETAPVVVYRPMTSVFSTYVTAPVLLTESVSRCLCKHFIIRRMTQNIVKNIIDHVALSYQVNLAIEIISNITENYINSHILTCQLWVSAKLI